MSSDRIIVALDYEDPAPALSLVRQLRDHITFFKVGSQLFTRGGPELIWQLRSLGVDVFLDLKFHDIPATVAHAVRETVKLEVRFTTIHLGGGVEMIRAAVQAAVGTGTTVLGVTVLTSLNDEALREVNVKATVSDQVLHLARLGRRGGLQGLVCSPWEVKALRGELGPATLLVTPGIRTSTEAKQDQKRTLSAREALQEGSSFLVIGRPITQAPHPLAAATALLKEIAECPRA